MEEKLGRDQPGVEAVSHETLGWRLACVFVKVRQTAILESIRNTLARNNLLADTGDHLGDVDVGTLGPGLGHDERSIVLA